MTSLSKNSCLFSRDEKGELLPIEVELESLEDKPKIKILPLTKGALNFEALQRTFLYGRRT